MPVDAALVDTQDAALAGVGRVEMANPKTLAAFGAEGVEGLLPFCVGGPVRRFISRGENPVLVVVSLLDDGADFVLWLGVVS